MYTNDKWSYSISWLHVLPLACHVLLFLGVVAQFAGLPELPPAVSGTLVELPAIPEQLDSMRRRMRHVARHAAERAANNAHVTAIMSLPQVLRSYVVVRATAMRAAVHNYLSDKRLGALAAAALRRSAFTAWRFARAAMPSVVLYGIFRFWDTLLAPALFFFGILLPEDLRLPTAVLSGMLAAVAAARHCARIAAVVQPRRRATATAAWL